MKFSEDTIKILDFLEEFTPGGLRKRSDLGAVLEIGAGNELPDKTNEIIFVGAGFRKLSQILKRGDETVENLSPTKTEFANRSQELVGLLKFFAEFDEEVSARFEQVYFREDRGAILNLSDLAHDLASLKKLQNRARKEYGSSSDS